MQRRGQRMVGHLTMLAGKGATADREKLIECGGKVVWGLRGRRAIAGPPWTARRRSTPPGTLSGQNHACFRLSGSVSHCLVIALGVHNIPFLFHIAPDQIEGTSYTQRDQQRVTTIMRSSSHEDIMKCRRAVSKQSHPGIVWYHQIRGLARTGRTRAHGGESRIPYER